MNNIRMGSKEWGDYLWARIKSIFGGLDTRVTAQEQAGYITQETDPTVPSWAKQSTKPTYTATEVGAIPATDKGAASGVAELDSGGKVPSSQLPSYVDDVLEYDHFSDFPATGESGKIYIDKDTGLAYRWTGSDYVDIPGGLALGETSSTAYRGDRGKAAYDHAQAHGSAFASGLYKITTNSEGHVTGAVAVVKSDIIALGVVGSDDFDNLLVAFNYVTMTGQAQLREKVDKVTGKDLSTNDYTNAEKDKLAGIESGAQVNSVTGVKGSAESNYRTGNINITKANIGLGSVDNTSDADKPVSTATRAAIDAVDTDAGIDRVAFNYAYMTMQAELRDTQKRLEIVEAQLAALS